MWKPWCRNAQVSVCSHLCNCCAVQSASPGTQHCHWPALTKALSIFSFVLADNVPCCSAELTWAGPSGRSGFVKWAALNPGTAPALQALWK